MSENTSVYKGLLRFTGYLVFSLSFGIMVTLIVSQIGNIIQEKQEKERARKEIENVALSFRRSVKEITPEMTADFIKNYINNVRYDKLSAVDVDEEGPPSQQDLYYLFTFNDPPEKIDIYIKKAYLERTARAVDPPEIIEGFIVTMVVFISILLYAERKRQTAAIWKRYKTETAELTKSLHRQEALALLGRMTASLAHELKTPIATLSNLIQALPSRINDERFTERFIHISREEIRRTQQLVDNLLLYGKDVLQINEEAVELTPFLSALAVKNHIGLTAEPGLVLYGDRFYLTLLFDNILRNSVQAGAKAVTIKTGDPFGQEAELRVEDDGGGFPDGADLSELINPFVTSRSSGAGLGLFLVQRIAEAHGGAVFLYRPQKGAGIRITLPMKSLRRNEHG